MATTQSHPHPLRRYNLRPVRVSFNGRTLASQANNVGSIPITRSITSKVLI